MLQSNDTVLAHRRELGLGEEIARAASPADFAYAHGWLAEDLFRMAGRLSSLYRQAGFPAVRGVERDTLDAKGIAAIWDKVFCDEGPAPHQEARAAEAMRLYRALMADLPGAVQAEVFWVCIGRSWPQWVLTRANGGATPAGELARRRLQDGLAVMAARWRRLRPGAEAPPPSERRGGPFVEQRVLYVDEEGRELTPAADRTGASFEVYRRRRGPRHAI